MVRVCDGVGGREGGGGGGGLKWQHGKSMTYFICITDVSCNHLFVMCDSIGYPVIICAPPGIGLGQSPFDCFWSVCLNKDSQSMRF